MANLVFNITSAVANVMSWYTSIDQIVFFLTAQVSVYAMERGGSF